jgi:hypothetical protein
MMAPPGHGGASEYQRFLRPPIRRGGSPLGAAEFIIMGITEVPPFIPHPGKSGFPHSDVNHVDSCGFPRSRNIQKV